MSAFYAVTAAALAWRRRHPLAVLFCIAAVDLVQFLSIDARARDGGGFVVRAVLPVGRP